MSKIGNPRFTQAQWSEFLRIGAKEQSFDWDISCGYVTFGSVGMTVHRIKNSQWFVKTVNNWRKMSANGINAELRAMDWIPA